LRKNKFAELAAPVEQIHRDSPTKAEILRGVLI